MMLNPGQQNKRDRFSAKTGDGTVAPIQRDLADVAIRIGRWLGTRIAHASNVEITNLAYPKGAGLSSETILFDASWRLDGRIENRSLVLRVKPGSNRVYYDSDFESQFRIMERLHRGDHVPVARPLWFEPGPEPFGQPFFVMEKVAGRVPVSFPPYTTAGWLADATEAERRTAWDSAVRALAALHHVPLEDVAWLDRPRYGATGFDQELGYWRESYAWAQAGRSTPFLDRVLEWLHSNLPAERPSGLCWGDARIGNMMFDDDFKVVAVMDWEQATLGNSLQDLAWWIVLDEQTDIRAGEPRPAGLGTREETIALWREVTGAEAADLHWYEVFALFKLSAHVLRMLVLDGSGRPGFEAEDNSAVHALARRLGFAPAKAG